MKRDLSYYQKLPYSRRSECLHEERHTPYWVAWIEELPGCKTDGATLNEALLHLDSAFDDYIEAMLEFGSSIPAPTMRNVIPEALEVELSQLSPAIAFELGYRPGVDLQTADDEDESCQDVSSLSKEVAWRVDDLKQDFRQDAASPSPAVSVAAGM